MEGTYDAEIAKLALSPLPQVVNPMNNTSTPEKVELGRLLFWDPIIGGEKDVACATCHHPDFAYTDGLSLSIGVRGVGLGPNRVKGEGIDRVPRNSPSILNTAFNGITEKITDYNPDSAIMFWDGRAHSLEEQCKKPPTSRSEMLGDFIGGQYALEYILPRLVEIPEYVTLFGKAFPREENPVNIKNYGKAIAAFERSLVTKHSPFDQYLAGDLTALTKSQKQGLLLFFGKAKCAVCHSGPMLSDYSFHALGVKENPLREELGGPDKGNQRYDDFKFRTPTLRNVSLTPPYMHNGMYETLEDVMNFYVSGKSENPYVIETSEQFESLDLSDDEISFIIDFMISLEDNDFDKRIPESVPSGLNPGGNIK